MFVHGSDLTFKGGVSVRDFTLERFFKEEAFLLFL
jgi:hypothetical protein